MEWSTPPQWAPSKSYASWLPPSCWWIIHIHSVLATFHLHQSPWESSSIIEIIIQPKCDSKTTYTPEKLTLWSPKSWRYWFRWNLFPFFKIYRDFFSAFQPYIFQEKIGAPRKMGSKEFCWFSGRNLPPRPHDHQRENQDIVSPPRCSTSDEHFPPVDPRTSGPPNSSPFCALVPNSYGRSLGRNISTLSCWFTEGCLNPTFFHESMHQTLDIPYPSLKSTQTAKLVNAATEPYFKTEVISMTSHRFHKF